MSAVGAQRIEPTLGIPSLAGNTFQRLLLPEVRPTYGTDASKDSPATSNSVRINLEWEFLLIARLDRFAGKGRDNLFSKSTAFLSLIESQPSCSCKISRFWIPTGDQHSGRRACCRPLSMM